MASKLLYPPIIDSYMPAFEASQGYCRIFFRLSKFNGFRDFTSIHATVVKQNTNMNVVALTDNHNRYRSTGIILNIKPKEASTEDDLYYIDIYDYDLSPLVGGFRGWIPDWTYKVQIRLSAKDYDGSTGQAAWLNNNAGDFSEWSTVCVLKAINHITFSIDILNIDTSDPERMGKGVKDLYSSTLPLTGKFSNCGSENIYWYNFILYDIDDNVLENSSSIFANQYQDNKSYNYVCKTELEDGKTYKLEFKFETLNHFIGGAYKYTTISGDEVDNRFEFVASTMSIDRITCSLITADIDPDGILDGITSVQEEEEEGRIGLKLWSSSDSFYSGNICIRRSSSRDNFKIWEDIKIYVAREENINTIPIIYDYIVESGVWYKYGVQKIDTDGTRGILSEISPIMRNFNFSYLLGKNNQQLKLMFDNTMGSFKIQLQESKINPISAVYPIVTRNAATKYRTFPINGLISFWMDENELFCNKKVIYEYEDVLDLYTNYDQQNYITQYNYIYERDFRKMVLDFLHDGEFKLFKSPTEGNIIVRLTDINCAPVQSLDRMIYNFTSNAQEMAEATMSNYLKYGFYDPGEYSTDFSTSEVKLGQLLMDFPVGTNIINEIYKKYDSQGLNLGGYRKTLTSIHHIKITFDDKPLRILNSSNEIVLGNNFSLNNQLFSVYHPSRTYVLDERLSFTSRDSLILLGDQENKVLTVHASIDFLYELQSEKYQEKQIQERQLKTGIGQLAGEFQPGDNIYKELYLEYSFETDYRFRKFNSLLALEIEANPGVVITIEDEFDGKDNQERHIINETGQLRLNDLNRVQGVSYEGIMQKDGTIKMVPADVTITYYYLSTIGTYKT